MVEEGFKVKIASKNFFALRLFTLLFRVFDFFLELLDLKLQSKLLFLEGLPVLLFKFFLVCHFNIRGFLGFFEYVEACDLT
jgi:hypothetical protein